MTRIFWIGTMAGCNLMGGAHEGGQSGDLGGEHPDQLCIEVDRWTVEDRTVVPEGFLLSADDALALVSGTFSGTWTEDKAESALTASLAWNKGPIIAIQMAENPDIGSGDDSGPAMEGAVAQCNSTYEIPLAGVFSEPKVSEPKFTSTFLATQDFGGTWALDGIGEGLAETPPKDNYEMQVYATTADGTSIDGSAIWHPIDDTSGVETDTGSSGTGTAWPSWTFATFTLARD